MTDKRSKKKKEPHRIPYDAWINSELSNSQLSIVRHYGSCTLNGKTYRLDFDGCKPNEHGKYFPDLVEVL